MITEQPDEWSPRPLPEPSGTRDTWRWTITRPADLTAARTGLRRLVTTASVPSGVGPEDVDRLLLVFEELASNGLRHSGASVEVQVDGWAGGWLVDVSDTRPERPPVPAVDRDPALGGLGLRLIARMSSAFGWAVVGPRKHVWAVLVPA
jgi:anti-sigma regulatory factor (Ser/Thr protein kinase)